MRELVQHTIIFYSSQTTDKQVGVTEVSTVSFTGYFPQILRLLQRSSLPIQLPLGHMLSDMFHANR
jgi:hypothetical protein